METRYFYMKTQIRKKHGEEKIHCNLPIYKNYRYVLIFLLVRIGWKQKSPPLIEEEGLSVLNCRP